MLRTVRLICWLASPAGLLLVGLAGAAAQETPSAADQGTPEARQACTPDAMRLCSDFIPDVPKITKCMIAKYAELSEPCRRAMGHGPKVRHHHHHRHHRKSHAHCKKDGNCP
jgi:hypothetical protein